MATKKTTSKETKSTAKTSKKSGNVETSKKEKETKKPLLSTKRKVGIAVYFTFLATLALSFGAQIWMMDVFNPPATNEPNQTTTERTTQNQNLTEQRQQGQEEVSPATQNNAEVQENNQMEQQEISQNYEFQTPDGQYYPTINL